MTIPPIGSPPAPSSPPDDRPERNNIRPSRPEQEETAPPVQQAKANHVEISPEAQRLRDRQTEITRLQVAERAAQDFIREARDVRHMFRELREARQERDEQAAQAARGRIENQVRQTAERPERARFADEDLFDGREMQVRIGEREETIRMPDARAEIRRFEREIEDALREEREPSEDDLFPAMREVEQRARGLRSRIEEDVREAIAGTVRESSHARPRDVEDAQRLIDRARSQQSDATDRRPQGIEQITRRAGKLLE